MRAPLVPALAAVLFDFDGVILDSEPLHEQALQELHAERGWALDDPHFRAFKGRTEAVNFAEITARFGGDSAAHRARYRQNYDALVAGGGTLVPGILALLERCRAEGLSVAIVTSARRTTVDDVLDAHDLERFVHTVVADEDVTHAKPHPEPYRLGAARLGVDLGRCLVVEDSAHGAASGAAAGAVVAGRVASFPDEALRAAGAVFTFEHYEALMEALWP